MTREQSQRGEVEAAPASFDAKRGMVLASKYRVDAVLGSGGMGVVLAATHLQLEEPFAIKLLHKEAATRNDSISRFLQEARIAMRLRGEHVVRVYDVGTLEDGSPFIAMERLEGRDLRVVLAGEGRLAPKLAVDCVVQACEAIAEAHELGVIHRDLKPANIFLTRRIDGSPCIKVLDFGVSKIAADAAAPGGRFSSSPPEEPEEAPSEFADTVRAPGITRTRALLGSPKYMAPEQLRSARDVDVRADVWALGAILFELVSGQAPFDGNSLEEIRRTVTSEPAPPLAGVPGELEWVVQRCLAKEPRQRFASVCDLAQALAPFTSEEGARVVERIARLPRATRPGAEVKAATEVGAARDPAPMTEDAVVDGATAQHAPRKVPIFVAGVVLAALGAAALVVVARHSSQPVTGRSEALPQPSVDLAEPGPAEAAKPPARVDPPPTSPPPSPPAAAVLRAHPSSRPPQAPRPSAAAVASVQSSPPPPWPDPLRIDAGALFDQRK